MKKLHFSLLSFLLFVGAQAQTVCQNFDNCGALTANEREHTFNLYGNGNPGCLADWEVTNGTPSIYNSFLAPYSGTDYALFGIHNSSTTESAALRYNFQTGETYTVTMAIANNSSSVPMQIDFILMDTSINYTYTTSVGSSAIPAVPAGSDTVHSISNFTSTAWQLVTFTITNLPKDFSRLWIRQYAGGNTYLFVDSLCITHVVNTSYCESFDNCGALTANEREHTFNLYGNGNPGCLADWEVTNGTPSIYNSFLAPYSGTDYALFGIHNSSTTESAALKYNFQTGVNYTVTMALANNSSSAPMQIDFILMDTSISYTYTTGVGSSAIPAAPAGSDTVHSISNFTSTTWQVVSFSISNLPKNFSRLWIRQKANSNTYLFIDSLCITSGGTTTSVDAHTTIHPATVSLFPNPASDRLNILVSGNQNASVAIFNLQGQMILQSTTQKTMDVSTLPSGVYIAEVSMGNAVVRKRWVKM